MSASRAATPLSPTTQTDTRVAPDAPIVRQARVNKRPQGADSRHWTPRQPRQASGSHERAIAEALERRQVVNAINAGTLSLDAGNGLLAAMNRKQVKGARQVAFRLNVRIRAPYNGFASMIEYGRAVIEEEFRQLRWTRLDECPEGFGIDEPTAPGEGGIVHTTLRLIVMVPAYQDEDLDATARELLHRDLNGLARVEPAGGQVTLWDEEVTSWDEYFVDLNMNDSRWPINMG